MSQTIFDAIIPATTSGNQLAVILNDFKAAIVSGLSGVSRPTELEAGGGWIDTNTAGYYIYKVWTGSVDVEIFRVNLTAGTASSTSAENLFTLTKISADTAAPILQFIKKRIANDGQVLIGDYLGQLEFSGDDDAGATPVVARIRAIATNNFTTGTAGTDLVFEATTLASAAIAEVMRIKDGRVGINTNAPDNALHVVGNGIRGEKRSDDAVGMKLILKKERVTGFGQVQSADVIASQEYISTDEAGAEVAAAKTEVIATELHTSTAQGTKISHSIKKIGAAVYTEQVVIGETIQLKDNTSVTGTLAVSEAAAFAKVIATAQQVDSTTTGSAQSITPTKSVYKVTDSSLASINNIATPTDGKLLILLNGTGASITLINNSGGTSANRIRTGTGIDLTVFNGASVFLAYDSNSSLWQVVGGSGGGGAVAQGTRAAGISMSVGTAITPTINQESHVYVVGNGGAIEITAVTPVVTTSMVVGQKLRIIGTSDTNTVKYNPGVNLVLTRGPAELGKDQCLDLMYAGTDGTDLSWIETGRNF